MDSSELLINEVKKYTMLYNVYSTGYRNYEKKRRIWEIISKRVGESDSNCRSKWSRMRDSYLKCLRRKVEEPNWVCKWPYFEKMRFLDDVDLLDNKASKEIESEEFIVGLIQLVKSNELLYNKSHIDYRDQGKRNVVWEDIAIQLNSPVEKCKKRWRSLRDRYFVLSKSGKPSWTYFKQLNFLEAYKIDDVQNCYEDETTETTKAENGDIFFDKLIEEVKKHGVLYDTSYAESKPNEKSELWEKIAKKLEKTVKECQKQFNVLSQTYHDINKKNSTETEKKSKQWKFYSKMAFLNMEDNNKQSYINEADIEQSLNDLIEEDNSYEVSVTEEHLETRPEEPTIPENPIAIDYLSEEDYNAMIEEIIETNGSSDEGTIDATQYAIAAQTSEQQNLTNKFDKFVDNTLEQLNTLSEKQKRQLELQKDSISLLFTALTRSVQESELTQQQLIKLHEEVSSFVLNNLAKYISNKKRKV